MPHPLKLVYFVGIASLFGIAITLINQKSECEVEMMDTLEQYKLKQLGLSPDNKSPSGLGKECKELEGIAGMIDRIL